MLDWSKIAGFDWDGGNARKSVDKHGVAQTEAEQAFFNVPVLVLEDRAHSETERRLHALGQTNEGRKLHVTFTLRRMDTAIRVISSRDVNAKERLVYDQVPQTPPALRR
jgi:uncharacterized DUF497 family protein